ncbi:MAG TPA: hypothetical protein VFG22_11070 [Polyangiales bacterium]|nr:hypothetical protein [Polyangiales bacterium]
MNKRVCSVAGVLAPLLFISTAAAQGAWSYEPTPTSPYTSTPVPEGPAESTSERSSMDPGLIGSFTLGVPVWLDADRSVVRPGVDLDFFGGVDIGYAVFGLALGAMWTPINYNDIDGAPPNSGYGRKPMTRLYLAPELRAQIPNKSRLLPYLGVTFDANWWRVRSTDIQCGVYYCRVNAVFLFTPGMTAKIGFAISVSSGALIDIGFKYSLSGPGSFFSGREQWVTPYIGMMFR